MWKYFFGCLTCSRSYRKDKKFHKRASDHIENDFDLLKMIKKLRLIKTQLATLMEKPQTRMCTKISNKPIKGSDSSSQIDSEIEETQTKEVVQGNMDQSVNWIMGDELQSGRSYKFLDHIL